MGIRLNDWDRLARQSRAPKPDLSVREALLLTWMLAAVFVAFVVGVLVGWLYVG